MPFTKTDKEIMNIILRYQDIYDLIVKETLKYKFNITLDNVMLNDLYIDAEDIDSQKTIVVKSIPYGKLDGNIFSWSHGELIRNHVSNNMYIFSYSNNLPQRVINTFKKFIKSQVIVFDDKYKNVIPLFLSLISNSLECNLIQFHPADNSQHNDMTVYNMISVPVYLPEVVMNEINNIFIDLRNF